MAKLLNTLLLFLFAHTNAVLSSRQCCINNINQPLKPSRNIPGPGLPRSCTLPNAVPRSASLLNICGTCKPTLPCKGSASQLSNDLSPSLDISISPLAIIKPNSCNSPVISGQNSISSPCNQPLPSSCPSKQISQCQSESPPCNCQAANGGKCNTIPVISCQSQSTAPSRKSCCSSIPPNRPCPCTAFSSACTYGPDLTPCQAPYSCSRNCKTSCTPVAPCQDSFCPSQISQPCQGCSLTNQCEILPAINYPPVSNCQIPGPCDRRLSPQCQCQLVPPTCNNNCQIYPSSENTKSLETPVEPAVEVKPTENSTQIETCSAPVVKEDDEKAPVEAVTVAIEKAVEKEIEPEPKYQNGPIRVILQYENEPQSKTSYQYVPCQEQKQPACQCQKCQQNTQCQNQQPQYCGSQLYEAPIQSFLC